MTIEQMKRLMWANYIVGVVVAIVMTAIFFHDRHIISDQQQYIDAGCHGRYQGE